MFVLAGISIEESLHSAILSAVFVIGWSATLLAVIYALAHGYVRGGLKISAFLALQLVCWPAALYIVVSAVAARVRKERQEITDRLDLIAAQLGMLQPPEPRPPHQDPPAM